MARRLAVVLVVLWAAVGCRGPAPREAGEGDEPVTPPMAEAPRPAEPADEEIARLLEAAEFDNSQVARVDPRPALVENMVLFAGVGARDSAADDATAYVNVGVAYGAMLWEVPGIRWQADAQFGRREGERFDSRISAGLFFREGNGSLDPEGSRALLSPYQPPELSLGGGVYADYVRTRDDSDLFGLHGIVGASVSERHHVGVASYFSLNKERVEQGRRAGIGERILIRHDLSWGYEWSEQLGSEISVGYQSGHVDGPVFGLRVGALVRSNVMLRPSFESNLEGDFAAGLQLVWEFGGERKPLTLTRYGAQSDSDHTPFLPPDLGVIHLDRD